MTTARSPNITSFARIWRRVGVFAALIVLVIAASLLSDRFLTLPNLLNILRQVAIVGILAIVIASLLMLGAMQVFGIAADPSIIAFALLITAVVFAISVISNDNLQDLKTGQLVAARNQSGGTTQAPD